MISEEKVTISIIKWLKENGWEIICYDFPQSGTGIILHPNQRNIYDKNKNGIIPDIIAIKDERAVFFENKDRFVLSDFEKIFSIKISGNYSHDLKKLVNNRYIYYGIGIPKTKNNVNRSILNSNKVDFIITVDSLRNIHIEFDINNIFKL